AAGRQVYRAREKLKGNTGLCLERPGLLTAGPPSCGVGSTILGLEPQVLAALGQVSHIPGHSTTGACIRSSEYTCRATIPAPMFSCPGSAAVLPIASPRGYLFPELSDPLCSIGLVLNFGGIEEKCSMHMKALPVGLFNSQDVP